MYKQTRTWNGEQMENGVVYYYDAYQGEYVDKHEMKKRITEAIIDETFDKPVFDSIIDFAGFEKRAYQDE